MRVKNMKCTYNNFSQIFNQDDPNQSCYKKYCMQVFDNNGNFVKLISGDTYDEVKEIRNKMIFGETN